LNALAPGGLDVGEAAVGLHNHEVAGKFPLAQPALEIAEILAYLRAHVGIGRHCGRAFIFAVLARQLVRGAQKQLGLGLPQNLAHAKFVLGRPIGMEKQNRHRFKAFFPDDAGHLARFLRR
jgi:hypothetical protein